MQNRVETAKTQGNRMADPARILERGARSHAIAFPYIPTRAAYRHSGCLETPGGSCSWLPPGYPQPGGWAWFMEEWVQPLYEYPICFSNHRISFHKQKATKDSPLKGNAFVYFGGDIERFTCVFTHHDIGCVLIRHTAGESHSK